jgi:hypothetical protein
VAHRKRGWQAWMTLGGLGSLFNMLVVLPIALWDWQQIGFPLLLQTQALPQWVNASLWGIMGVVGCDVLYTTLALVVRTPLGKGVDLRLRGFERCKVGRPSGIRHWIS